MDTDIPLLSSIVLGISLAVFTLVSFAGAAISSVRRDRVQRLVALEVPGATKLESLYTSDMGPTAALQLLLAISFASTMIAVVALVISQAGILWTPIALAGAAALLGLGAIYGTAWTLAPRYGEGIALKLSGPTRGLALVCNPLLTTAASFVRLLFRVPNTSANGSAETLHTEIRVPLEEDGEPLDETEVRMIRGVVSLDDTVAREIMIPRGDMVVAEIGTPIGELAEQMISNGHSRIPVYKETLDRIEGIAYARDILRQLSHEEGPSDIAIESIVRQALFIPESKTLEELLEEFQKTRVHMAIVVDEYGGVSGLVTIEDLLEEIVGEIMDEFDIGDPEVESLNESEFMLDARVSIDDINEMLSVSLEGDGFDTIGGFVYQRLGKIPSQGDLVEYDGVKIEVISTVGRRLKRLRVTKSQSTSSQGAGAELAQDSGPPS